MAVGLIVAFFILLPPVEGKDVSQWELASVGAWGNQDFPLSGVLGSRELVFKILLLK